MKQLVNSIAFALLIAGVHAERTAAAEYDRAYVDDFPATSAPSGENAGAGHQFPPPLTSGACSESMMSTGRCGGCGCDAWGCQDCGCCCGCRNLFESDHAFDSFVEPVTNPVFFEDPRSRTRLRFLFINQMIDEDSILQGGDYQLYAAQLTVALNERWSIIAQKDGFISLQADGIPNEEGWADLATGLKYVLVRDPQNQFLLSGGCMLEWSNGSREVFQGNGDGVWNFFLTAGKELAPCGDAHFVGTVGWHLPMHGGQESESWFYSVHLDRRVVGGLYALWELTGTQYVDSGRRLSGVTMEGGDLINLGAGNVTGNNLATTAFGATYKFSPQLEAAAAYEFPISNREDLMDNRTTVTLSLIY